MDTEAFTIETLSAGEVNRALAFYSDYTPSDIAFLSTLMVSGDITVVMAVVDGRDVGAFYLNRIPKYELYIRMDLPEMQDLRVLPEYRNRGIATALLAKAEEMAAPMNGLGISVGLHAGFGAAQRLYIKSGYMPDGRGVTYDRAPVPEGQKRPVDGDLCLMLMKLFA